MALQKFAVTFALCVIITGHSTAQIAGEEEHKLRNHALSLAKQNSYNANYELIVFRLSMLCEGATRSPERMDCLGRAKGSARLMACEAFDDVVERLQCYDAISAQLSREGP